MCRFVGIAQELGISVFVVVDADGDENNAQEHNKHRRDNACILNLCSLNSADPLPNEVIWGDNIVMWPTQLADKVRADFGEDVWAEAENKVRQNLGLHDGVRRKNRMLIAATLEELWNQERKSATLLKLCAGILRYGEKMRI